MYTKKERPEESKRKARLAYRDRQIDKWVNWSWNMRNRVKFKELVKQQDKYNLKCYGNEDN